MLNVVDIRKLLGSKIRSLPPPPVTETGCGHNRGTSSTAGSCARARTPMKTNAVDIFLKFPSPELVYLIFLLILKRTRQTSTYCKQVKLTTVHAIGMGSVPAIRKYSRPNELDLVLVLAISTLLTGSTLAVKWEPTGCPGAKTPGNCTITAPTQGSGFAVALFFQNEPPNMRPVTSP